MRKLTGLFLGAGATCEVGMPLVWELTSELRRWLTPEKLRGFNASWHAQGGGHSAGTIEHLVRLLEHPDLHYEAILGSLETEYRRLGASREAQLDFHGLYGWLIEMVYHLLYFRHVRNTEFFERVLPTLDGIANFAAENAPLWVFTLNHDLMIECFAARHRIKVSCGLGSEIVELPRRDGSGRKIGVLRAEALGAADFEAGSRPFIRHGEPGINLLKIHGGLDQFTFRDGKDLLRVLPDEDSIAGVLGALRAANEELFYLHEGRKPKATNEIAYADDAGEMQFLRRTLLSGAFKFDPNRDQVLPKKTLDHFRSNLNWVSRLICIGYGFGDTHINQLLRGWLEATPDRHIEIVDPFVKAIPPFLLHVPHQVTIVRSSGSDYLDRAAGIVRTRSEVVAKQLTAYSRGRPKEEVQEDLRTFINANMESVVRAFVERVKDLPLKEDGDLDIEKIGTTPEEYARKFLEEQGRTNPDAMIEAFLASRSSAS